MFLGHVTGTRHIFLFDLICLTDVIWHLEVVNHVIIPTTQQKCTLSMLLPYTRNCHMSGQVTVHYDCWWQDPIKHCGDVGDICHHSVGPRYLGIQRQQPQVSRDRTNFVYYNKAGLQWYFLMHKQYKHAFKLIKRANPSYSLTCL